MTQRVDAAVVGGGPAGAVAARLLALAGCSVILIERGATNRHKTCGHCLSPRALPMLRQIGLLDRTLALARGETRSLRVHTGRGRPLQVSLPTSPDSPGVLVRRTEFDRMLRQAACEAGAVVLQPVLARVRTIDDDGFTLDVACGDRRHIISGRLLVGADGVGSAVARAAGLADRTSAGRKYGFAFDLNDSASPRTGVDAGVIEMFLGEGGYLGAVRQSDDALHLASLVNCTAAAPRDPGAFLRHLAAGHPMLSRHGIGDVDTNARAFAAVGPMPWTPRAVASRSVALVGDAAGYAEPFTGEGMTWAIESALLLGQTIDENGGAWSIDSAKAYRRAWRNVIARRQQRCRLIARGLERPRLARLTVGLGRAAPGIVRRVVREVVGA